jgi:lipopolysaccharide/colanic/teichoic acid biosynthesis glycosyltransferase
MFRHAEQPPGVDNEPVPAVHEANRIERVSGDFPATSRQSEFPNLLTDHPSKSIALIADVPSSALQMQSCKDCIATQMQMATGRLFQNPPVFPIFANDLTISTVHKGLILDENCVGTTVALETSMIANYEQILSDEAAIPRWKRVLDVALVFLSLPLTLLVGAVIALVIRVVSPGPIFFKQERVGHLGKRFMIVKFRTMKVNADTSVHTGHTTMLMRSDAPMLKMDAKGDSRIIPFGTWIRAAGLDELPQLLNVLRGEMTLVGPRPCLPVEFEQFNDWRRERFNTLPGLTGLWQVSGKNNTTFHEMVQLDIEYSRTKTLALDLEIIVRTVPALLVQVGEMRQCRKQKSTAAQGNPTPANATAQPDLSHCRTCRRNSAFPSRNSKNFGRNVRPIVGPL